jgi:uncharacterized repeat protein (TIGR01451 family)
MTGRAKVWIGDSIVTAVAAVSLAVFLLIICGSCVSATVTAACHMMPDPPGEEILYEPVIQSPRPPLGTGLAAAVTAGSGSRDQGPELSECAGIDFGEVSPSLSPYVVPMAFQITCISRENPIQVTIQGEDLKPVDEEAESAKLSGQPRTIPCSRLSWKVSGEPSWSRLTREPAPVAEVPPGETRNISLDFRYEVRWEDPVGEYSAPVTVSFLPRAEVVLSKAFPNPFSPNGDGVKDETLISCELTWDQDEPEAIECMLNSADEGSSEPVRTIENPDVKAQSTAWVIWDGTDEDGQQVPDGCYQYRFHKAGQTSAFSSGIVVVDTTAPDLAVFSPKTGDEVASSVTVTGKTDSEDCLVSVFIHNRLASQARPAIDGSFSLAVVAPPGMSTLSVVSEDFAGNRASYNMDLVNNSAVTISGPSYRKTRSPVAEFRGLAPVSARISVIVNGKEVAQAESTEQGAWVAGGVQLVPGDNTVTASAINQRGETVVAKEPVTVRYVPSEGSGKITGRVTDKSTGKPLEGAEVSLVSKEDGILNTDLTSAGGWYELNEIPPGTYTVQASCVNYCTLETDPVEIVSGEELVFDVALVPNVALRLEKTVNVDACSIGDIVEYTLSLENLLDIEVNNVKVYDLLPAGITVIPGTTVVSGIETELTYEENTPACAVWTIDTLGPHKTATVSFKAAVGFCEEEFARNKAYATGETGLGSVKTPISEATLFVSKGVFREDGLVFGKVFFDMDNDGEMDPDEHGLCDARIITEDGTMISTDYSGMYSIKGVRPEFHMLVLSADSLPEGCYCEERTRLTYVAPYSIVRLDFPVTQCEPASDITETLKDSHAACVLPKTQALSERLNQESMVMIAVGEGTLSLSAPSGMSLKDSKSGSGNSSSQVDASGNLAFFMSTNIGEHHTLTCGLDLARGGAEDFEPSDSGRKDFDVFSPDYGDRSKVVGALPYAGPLYISLKGDVWEASYRTLRTDFIKSELASCNRVLPGVIIRYGKDDFKATYFDSTPFTTSNRILGGAFDTQVSTELTLGGGLVRHWDNQDAVDVYYIRGEYQGDDGFSAHSEIAGSSTGDARGGLGVKVRVKASEGISETVGIRWGERWDHRSTVPPIGYRRLEAEAETEISKDVSISLKGGLVFESEDADLLVPASRPSGKLGIGVSWTASPHFAAGARASISSLGGTAFSFRCAYRPSPRLDAALNYEAWTKRGESKLALNVAANPIPGLKVNGSWDKKETLNESTSLGYELSFAWRPVYRDRLMAFGGIKSKEVSGGQENLDGNTGCIGTEAFDGRGVFDGRRVFDGRGGFNEKEVFDGNGVFTGKEAYSGSHREFRRILTGELGLAFAIDPLTDLSVRYIYKQVYECGSGRVSTNSADPVSKIDSGQVSQNGARQLSKPDAEQAPENGAWQLSKQDTGQVTKRSVRQVPGNNAGTGAGTHVETALAAFRITRKLDLDGFGLRCKYPVDVACESSFYFVDVEKQRKTESAVEVGISFSENVRFALGYKWTKSRQGATSGASSAACSVGSSVYVRLGLGFATGI